MSRRLPVLFSPEVNLSVTNPTGAWFTRRLNARIYRITWSHEIWNVSIQYSLLHHLFKNTSRGFYKTHMDQVMPVFNVYYAYRLVLRSPTTHLQTCVRKENKVLGSNETIIEVLVITLFSFELSYNVQARFISWRVFGTHMRHTCQLRNYISIPYFRDSNCYSVTCILRLYTAVPLNGTSEAVAWCAIPSNSLLNLSTCHENGRESSFL